jgi:aspartate/tyrosine/aromatic aminotransferase
VFETIEAAPPDPILGLAERIRADPRPDKIDLTAGVYKDERGITPIFECVRVASLRHLESETTKAYHPIAGPDAYADQVEELVFGADDHVSGRLRTTQTPGGTGALAIAGGLLAATFGPRRVWLSEPTWPNHGPVFRVSGHELVGYRYYEAEHRRLDFSGLIDDLSRAEAGDVVVLHGCCHNPTGRDLDLEQWRTVADLLVSRGLIGLVDFAYLGLARGLEADAAFLAPLLASGADLLVCTSFSKNMGLYRERVGALTLVASDDPTAEAVQSNVKRTVRSLYSNPPSFGGAVAATVLADPELRADWVAELAIVRDRLNQLRLHLAEAVADAGLQGFGGVETEYGMFTLTGLSADQVEWLRVERGIYLVDNGRANVAGLREEIIPRVVEGIRDASRHA